MARVGGRERQGMRRACPGGQSRWSAGKDLSWEPLRIERVCEVKYDHMQGDRFRHAAVFLRWRPDKPPADCRYDQLEVTTPYELEKVFGAARRQALTPSQSFGAVVGIERLLRRPQLVRHVLQVHADPRPGAKPAAHRIDEHVGRLRCAAASGCRAFQRSSPASASSLCARGRSRSSGRLGTRRRDGCTRGGSPGLLPVVRRPRRVALTLALLARRQLEQAVERARDARRCPHADRRRAANRAGIVASVKSPGSHASTSSQASGADTRASGVGRTEYARGDRAVLRVLVVVEEHAVALFLPPLARRERRRAPLDLARQRQRGAAHLVERPAPLDAHVDVHAARARRLRPADEPEVGERRVHDARDLADLRPRRRPAPDRDRRAARRDDRDRRRAPDADAARGRRGWPSTRARRRRAARLLRRCARTESAARRLRSTAAATRARASGRRTRRRCRSDSGRARSGVRRRRAARRRRRRGSSARGRAWCSPACGNSTLRGFEIATSRPATTSRSCSVMPTRQNTPPRGAAHATSVFWVSFVGSFDLHIR